MDIFLLSRYLVSLPAMFLFWLGEPFTFKKASVFLSHYGKKEITELYNHERFHFYVPRFFVIFFTLLVLVFIFSLFWVYPKECFQALLFWTMIILMTDGVRVFGRYVYYTKTKEEAESTGQDLVLTDFWKDTNLTDLLKSQIKAKEEKLARIQKAKEEAMALGKHAFYAEGESHYV